MLVLKTAVVLIFFLVVPLAVGYIEHKVLAHMQSRVGPMEAGAFHGWAQLVADGVKFIQKEDIVPAAADRTVFSLAPAVAMIPYIAILVVLPFSDSAFALNLDVGIFFVMAMSSVSVIGVLMAGWSTANKFSLIGALRAAAQLIAYELPLVLAAAAVVMRHGHDLAGRHRRGTAEPVERRAPVPDVHHLHDRGARRAHAAAVRHAGRGLRDHLRRLHRVHGVEVRVLPARRVRRHRGALGRGRGALPRRVPRCAGIPLPGPLWMFGKIVALSFVIIWLRATYPRLREDQLQRFAWLVLIPLSLLWILGVAVVKVAVK